MLVVRPGYKISSRTIKRVPRMSLGTILYLNFVLCAWRYVGACLNNTDEVVTK
jgi:hypothetical protein